MRFPILDIYRRLLAHYGAQRWWPADTPFEVMVGAVLTQNTSWKNVRRAIDNLREAGLLEPRALYELPIAELEQLIQPAGYFRLKAGRLRNLLRLLCETYDGSLEAMFAVDRHALREQLLAVNGVGPETADSILLYAGKIPSFVVDTYTHRVLKRHGWIDYDADYQAIQERFESGLRRAAEHRGMPAGPAELYNEYHALLVRVGHEHCRKTPRCQGCPLEPLLGDEGPLEPPPW